MDQEVVAAVSSRDQSAPEEGREGAWMAPPEKTARQRGQWVTTKAASTARVIPEAQARRRRNC